MRNIDLSKLTHLILYVMKKLLLFLTFATLAFTGCSILFDDNDINTLTVFADNLSIESEGGEKSIEVSCTTSWRATCDVSWITFLNGGSSSGTSMLRLRIKENATTATRYATIIVSTYDGSISKKLYITQEKFAPEITISESEISTDDTSKNLSVTIRSNVSWTASCSANWITLRNTVGSKGGSTLNFTVKSKTDSSSRTTTIKVTNIDYDVTKEIIVTQGEFAPEITISESKFSIGVAEENLSVTINSNISWTASCNADWITLKNSEGSIGTSTLNFAVKANTEAIARSATIKVTNNDYNITKEINITQDKFYPKLSLSETLIITSIAETKKTITITSNVSWIASSDAGWVIVSPSSGSSGTSSFNITISDNTDNQSRFATITVRGKDYNISSTINIKQYVNNAISYTSSDGQIITPYNKQAFGASFLSNTYVNGKGTILFDGPISSIGENAFYNCSKLSSITIPNSVSSIGHNAFYSCSSLTSINIPNNITNIGDYAFYNCNNLTNANIPNRTTLIGNYAFYGSKVTSIIIPDSVISIGNSAFYGCNNVSSVSIGNGVTSIGKQAFYGCNGSLTINSKIIETNYSSSNYPMHSSNGWLYGSKFTKLTFGFNVTNIGDYSFNNCTTLTNITIPNSIMAIGDRAFSYCSKLTSITIPDSVTSISNSAFYYCSSLTNVTIGNSVSSIGESAFSYCSKLTSITIPDNVTLISSYAFKGCNNITNVSVGRGVSSIGIQAFYGCKGCLTINSTIMVGKNYPSADYPMYDGSNGWLFGSEFTEINIGPSVTTIGNRAFKKIPSVIVVTMSSNVTKVGDYAFYDCNNLISVYCKATTPPKGGLDMFIGNASGRKIYVPTNSLNDYKTAGYWKNYSFVGYNF